MAQPPSGTSSSYAPAGARDGQQRTVPGPRNPHATPARLIAPGLAYLTPAPGRAQGTALFSSSTVGAAPVREPADSRKRLLQPPSASLSDPTAPPQARTPFALSFSPEPGSAGSVGFPGAGLGTSGSTDDPTETGPSVSPLLAARLSSSPGSIQTDSPDAVYVHRWPIEDDRVEDPHAGSESALFRRAGEVQVASLKDALGRLVPAHVDGRDERISQTLQVLVDLGVTGHELDHLVFTGRLRDVFRNMFSYALRTMSSFGAAGVVGWLGASHPPWDPGAYSDESAQTFARAANLFALYFAGTATIAVGAELAKSWVRKDEGTLGMKYTQPAPLPDGTGAAVPYKETARARWAQLLEYWPFSVGHGVVGANAFNLPPVKMAEAFIVSSFLASCATGLSSALIPSMPPTARPSDPQWLDGRRGREALEKSIADLRQSSPRATAGYLADAASNLKTTAGTAPTRENVCNMLTRFAIASVCLIGRIPAGLARDEAWKKGLGAAAGGVIGVTWGWLLKFAYPPPPARQPDRADPAAATDSQAAAIAPQALSLSIVERR